MPAGASRAARTGTLADPKPNAVAQLMLDVVRCKGHPAPARVEAFLAAGYSNAALVGLPAFVAANSFNSYVQHLADVAVDFPAV